MDENKERGSQYEQEHVHGVYEAIASHFSSTRYKPWPIVGQFLRDLIPGAVGLDVGCGNGKYLTVNPNIFIIASDRSANLVDIATQHKHHATVVADTLDLPHPLRAFDFAISIAVIHHLSTPTRRVAATRALLSTLRAPSHPGAGDGGRALIFVWALEQKSSRRGWDEGDEQDVMVPWVMKQKQSQQDISAQSGDSNQNQTFQRYYHLYRQGELESDIQAAGGQVVDAGYEKDNWWAIAALRDP